MLFNCASLLFRQHLTAREVLALMHGWPEEAPRGAPGCGGCRTGPDPVLCQHWARGTMKGACPCSCRLSAAPSRSRGASQSRAPWLRSLAGSPAGRGGVAVASSHLGSGSRARRGRGCRSPRGFPPVSSSLPWRESTTGFPPRESPGSTGLGQTWGQKRLQRDGQQVSAQLTSHSLEPALPPFDSGVNSEPLFP